MIAEARREEPEAERRRRLEVERLAYENRGLIYVNLPQYSGRGLEDEDLAQEAFLGLMRAAELFDPTLGFKFSTYATYWIKQSMGRALLNKGHLIRVPAHHARPDSKCSTRAEALWIYDATYVRDEGENLLADIILDHRSGSREDLDLDWEAVERCLADLHPDQRREVCLYFGIGGREHTQQEAAAVLGISRERFRQRLNETLKRLRRMLHAEVA